MRCTVVSVSAFGATTGAGGVRSTPKPGSAAPAAAGQAAIAIAVTARSTAKRRRGSASGTRESIVTRVIGFASKVALMDFGLDGMVALVGGASKGIGRAIAAELIAEG